MTSEARQLLDQHTTEDELLAAVTKTATAFGWLWSHIPDRLYKLAAKEGRYDALPGAKGFPDLVLVRKGWLIFAELKTERGELEPEQVEWQHEIQIVQSMTEDGPPSHPEDSCRVMWCVWRPSNWSSGEIERILR